MKKIRIFILFIFVLLSSIACSNVQALDTTTVTTSPVTTLYTDSATDKTYVYSSYDDLVQQIYNDIYDEVYQNVYTDISAMVADQMYEDIYAQVTSDLNAMYSDGEISVYIQNLQNQIYDVSDLVKTSVIGVSSYLGSVGKAIGSGVIYNYNASTNTYYLITNNHVVEDGDNFRIVFSDGSYVVGNLLGVDADIDIAILSFSADGLDQTITVSSLGNSSEVIPGTVVLAAGNPQGYDFYGSITLGIVAGVNRDADGTGIVGYIQHDAPINGGNSGGPLYTLTGEVIGINVSKFASTDIEGMGFSIPIDLVKTVISEIAPTTLP